MNRDKQIEEMAKICHFYDDGICNLCEGLEPCDRECDVAILVKNLYTAGYRKSTDLAREIFEEIEKSCRVIVGRHIFNGQITCYLKNDIAELKKKYTEGERL